MARPGGAQSQKLDLLERSLELLSEQEA